MAIKMRKEKINEKGKRKDKQRRGKNAGTKGRNNEIKEPVENKHNLFLKSLGL